MQFLALAYDVVNIIGCFSEDLGFLIYYYYFFYFILSFSFVLMETTDTKGFNVQCVNVLVLDIDLYYQRERAQNKN